MSPSGTTRKSRHVRVESEMRRITDIGHRTILMSTRRNDPLAENMPVGLIRDARGRQRLERLFGRLCGGGLLGSRGGCCGHVSYASVHEWLMTKRSVR